MSSDAPIVLDSDEDVESTPKQKTTRPPPSTVWLGKPKIAKTCEDDEPSTYFAFEDDEYIPRDDDDQILVPPSQMRTTENTQKLQKTINAMFAAKEPKKQPLPSSFDVEPLSNLVYTVKEEEISSDTSLEDAEELSDGPPLSTEQQKVVDAILTGTSIFFTGAAGTGKSRVLHEAIKRLQNKFDTKPSAVAVTAPTGSAAVQIGGSTLHSYLGLGLGDGTVKELVDRINNYPLALTHWIQLHVLIIDEISMLSAELFVKLDAIARRIRPKFSQLPFGGIQLVLAGDFLQLPPVDKDKKQRESGQKMILDAFADDNDTATPIKRKARFAFETLTWSTIITKSFLLTEVFRQGNDKKLADILGRIRYAEQTKEDMKVLRRRIEPLKLANTLIQKEGEEKKVTTCLFARCKDADALNEKCLKLLTTPLTSHRAMDWCNGSSQGKSALKTLQTHCPGVELLLLKPGAQVISSRNDPTNRLVNGSRGRVVSVNVGRKGVMCGEFEGSEEDMARLLDFITVDFEGVGHVNVHMATWGMYEGFGEGKRMIAKRVQFPLIHGWAVTIHKSQGMTLTSAHVSIHGAFECGQVYVALSRVTTIEGLTIERDFSDDVIMADPVVCDFYKRLATAA